MVNLPRSPILQVGHFIGFVIWGFSFLMSFLALIFHKWVVVFLHLLSSFKHPGLSRSACHLDLVLPAFRDSPQLVPFNL